MSKLVKSFKLSKGSIALILYLVIIISITAFLIVGIGRNQGEEAENLIIKIKIPEEYVGKRGMLNIELYAGINCMYCVPIRVYTDIVAFKETPGIVEVKIPRKLIQLSMDKYMDHHLVKEGNMAITKVSFFVEEGEERIKIYQSEVSADVTPPVSAWDFPNVIEV